MNSSSATEDVGEEKYDYKKIEELGDASDFPESGTGLYDLTKAPKDWIAAAIEAGNEITAGIGGDNEKQPVKDLETLLNTPVDYSKNFEIHLNDANDAVITCTDFFNPYTADSPCTVGFCLDQGWWKASKIVAINGNIDVENTVYLESVLSVFGKPMRVDVTNSDTDKTEQMDSIESFEKRISEELQADPDYPTASYTLEWSDGSKILCSNMYSTPDDNDYMILANLYGYAMYDYAVLGKEPDINGLKTDGTPDESENESQTGTETKEDGIGQVVFPGNDGKFTAITLKNDYRVYYFTVEVPSNFKPDHVWWPEYADYTMERYADEHIEKENMTLEGTGDYDSNFAITFDGAQISDDTNTERLARHYPDGVWVEENGLKAYVYDDGYIAVSVEGGDGNLLITFDGSTSDYSLEEYGRYILNKVTLVQ